MNHTRGTITDDNPNDFDPREAADLLKQTTRLARTEFEPDPPWLLGMRAGLGLVAYGALWLSVRGQHPYAHPTAAVIPVGIAVGIVNVVATIAVARHAAAGVSGRRRLRPAEIALMAVVWAAVLVAMWPMASAGVSDSVVYGLYPAAAPLIASGLAWAAIMAAHADWRSSGSGLAAAVLGAAALLAGPAGAWAVVGLGVFVLLAAHAVEISWRQHS